MSLQVPSPVFRNNLIESAKRIEYTAAVVRQTHFLAADRWDSVNTWLGLAAVLIGVIGGTVAGVVVRSETLNFNLSLASAFATITGLLGAANSFLKPADRVEKHKRAGDDWSGLRDQAAELYQITMNVANVQDDELKKDFDALLDLKKNITSSSPITPTWAYRKALKQVAR